MTDASTPSLPVLRPRVAASGLVFVERHLFRLSDPEAPELREAPLPAEDSPVTTGAGPDLALFRSVLEDGQYTRIWSFGSIPCLSRPVRGI